MALTTQLAYFFLSKVRKRGHSYYKSGAVEIINGNEEEVQAEVIGTDTYEVDLYRGDDTVYVFCSCPYFQGEKEPCKHIWAVLLSAEENGYLLGKDKGDPLYIEIDNEKDYLMDEDWEDEEEDIYLNFKSHYSPRLKGKDAIQPIRQPSGWRGLLGSLKKRFIEKQVGIEGFEKPRQVLYLIDVSESNRERCLAIEIAYRQMKKSGEWGKTKFYTSSYFKPEYFHDPQDQQILALLIGSQGSNGYYNGYSSYYRRGPSFYITSLSIQENLMRLITQTGRCFLRDANYKIEKSPMKWDDGEPWKFFLSLDNEKSANAYRLKGYLQRARDQISIAKPILFVAGGLFFFENMVCRFQDKGVFDWISFLRDQKSLLIPFNEGQDFVKELMMVPLIPLLSLPEELRYEEIHLTPKPWLKIIAPQKKTKWDADILNWYLAFDYDGELISYENLARNIFIEGRRTVIVRDLDLEHEAYRKIKTLGFREIYSYGELRREVSPKGLPRAIRELISLGWHVEVEGKVYRRPGPLKLSITSGIDWFELHGEAHFDDKIVKLPELLRAIKKGDNMILLDDGTFGMVSEEWLKRCGILSALGKAHDDHIRFSRCQAGLLDALVASQPDSRCDKVFEHLREELRSFEGIIPCDPPEGFSGNLRDYQKEGLGWIHFLEKFGFGGCLADDMGLGKTIQVLSMLEERRKKRKDVIEAQSKGNLSQCSEVSGPSLVVAPKSLVFNWIQEAQRFTPNLKILDHTGKNRLKPGEHFENYDLILTTYGTLRKDVVEFKDIEFDYCILDEGQMIKNANTQSAKASRLIKAKNRLVLSGTPIENHLGELWSLFEFLNPGMLGSASVFKLSGSRARNPDPQTRELLGKALRPFILRRTKRQVASELPEKFEQTLYCDLESVQRKLYNELRDHYRQTLLHQVDLDGINKSKIKILEALLRLRQAACHPGLIDRSKISYPSIKLDILMPQLEQIIEENYKVLVFSQFTSFLSILREQLDRNMTLYAYLDGQTRNRKAVVERFQQDPDCRLFLISLKAGGLGLNLTEAEYVYLLDPWWNPAVEVQAIDRTHRIGQTKKVFAYRIIARDTVEEKVLELQRTKKDLADAIINTDNSLIRNLTKEDLELLLS